jgi:hypothetical protein
VTSFNTRIIFWGLAWWYLSIIPATQEAEIKRIMVQGQPRPKVSETLISSHAWWCATVIPATQETCSLRLARPKPQDPISKITKAKKGLVGWETWLKLQIACLASTRPWFQTQYHQNEEKDFFFLLLHPFPPVLVIKIRASHAERSTIVLHPSPRNNFLNHITYSLTGY